MSSLHPDDGLNERIAKYLKDPLSFPLEFKQWVIGWIDQNPPATVAPRNVTSGAGASVAAGAASVVVTHGLGTTPARVYLSPTADTQGRRFWVSAKGATTFTITLDANAVTNPITFDWSAEF